MEMKNLKIMNLKNWSKKKKIIVSCITAFVIVGIGGTIAAVSHITEDHDRGRHADGGRNEWHQDGRENGSHDKMGKDGRDGKDGKVGHMRVDMIKVAASVLNQSEEEIRASIEPKDIGSLLTEANKLEEFKSAYLAEAKAMFDGAVAEGVLTQDKADEEYAEEQEKMADYDGTRPLFREKRHDNVQKPLPTEDSVTEGDTNADAV